MKNIQQGFRKNSARILIQHRKEERGVRSSIATYGLELTVQASVRGKGGAFALPRPRTPALSGSVYHFRMIYFVRMERENLWLSRV